MESMVCGGHVWEVSVVVISDPESSNCPVVSAVRLVQLTYRRPISDMAQMPACLYHSVVTNI